VIIDLNPKLMHLQQPGELEGFLFGKMDVTVVGESSILEFRFNSASPRISLMSVRALRDAFLEFYTFSQRDGEATEYYTEQIDLVRVDIDSLLDKRTLVLNESGYSSLVDELRYDTGQLANLENELFDAITDTRSIEAEYSRLKVFQAQDPRLFPMGEDQSRSQALIYWRNIVSKHEDTLNNLLSVHTANSIPVKRQQELLAMSLENLSQHVDNYVESVHVQLLKAQEYEKSLRELVGELEDKNRRAPLAYQQVSRIDAELASQRQLLEDLQGKLGEVRLSEMADERVSNLVILSDPEIMEVISGEKTFIFLALLIIFSLALGLVAAFVLEIMDHRIISPRDVEENLQLPVFASITKDE
jgi:uncharacterized protein involved in exopolysaccharide biosynthesis